MLSNRMHKSDMMSKKGYFIPENDNLSLHPTVREGLKPKYTYDLSRRILFENHGDDNVTIISNKIAINNDVVKSDAIPQNGFFTNDGDFFSKFGLIIPANKTVLESERFDVAIELGLKNSRY